MIETHRDFEELEDKSLSTFLENWNFYLRNFLSDFLRSIFLYNHCLYLSCYDIALKKYLLYQVRS